MGVSPRLGESGGVCGPPEIQDFWGTRNSGWRSYFDRGIRFLEAVLDEEMQIVTLVEHFALDIGVELTKATNLLVLLRHELLAHRRDLDVDVIFRQIEVGLEQLCGFTVIAPFDFEGTRLVCPVDSVEVEESREFPFAVVGEFGGFCL
jgi:hypothetical protein